MEILLIKAGYIFVIAFVLAVLEIQIEGRDGWASKLPTWRPGTNWFVKLFRTFSGQKELTGYHLALNLLLLLFFHLPFVWGLPWSLSSELEVLGFFLIFVVTWDFLWFILNPELSLSEFGPTRVWWHKHWWGPLPTDYYLVLTLAALAFFAAHGFAITPFIFTFGALVVTNCLLTLATIFLYPKSF